MRRWVGLCLAVGLSLGAMAEAPRPARTIPDFTLTDQNGEPWSTRDRQGAVTLVSFGYTSCPDVCPLTLQVLAAALRALGDRAEDVRVLFISVDPTRDRPDQVKDYVRYFDSRIVGLTGDKTAIDRVANHFGVTYAIGAETTDGGYTVDHSANLFVVDRAGQLVTIVPFGLPPEHIARTVRNLLDESVAIERGALPPRVEDDARRFDAGSARPVRRSTRVFCVIDFAKVIGSPTDLHGFTPTGD